MNHRLLADLTLIIHGGFVVFVVVGGLLALRWPRVAWLHVPAVLWGAGIELLGGVCPLTPLENHWRRLAGESGYGGGFVEHHLLRLLYPDGLTPDVQYLLGAGVLAVNALVYGRLWRRRRRRASPSRPVH